MLDALQAKDFEPHLNSSFQLRLDDENSLVLELIEVGVLAGDTPDDAKREPFALVFRSAESDAYLQQTYRLEHEAMGELVVFLVPIGPDKAGGMRYEAVFS